jgi:hypothetical protein
VIQREVQLHGPFGPPERRPGEDLGAQVDHTGVDRQQLVLEAELLLRADGGLAAPEELAEDLLVELPGAMFVRIGERALGRRGDAPVRQPALAAGQPAADLAERMRTPKPGSRGTIGIENSPQRRSSTKLIRVQLDRRNLERLRGGFLSDENSAGNGQEQGG